MIGVDWGTSSLRAWRLRDGIPTERRERSGGILQVQAGGFPAALTELAGDWMAAGEHRVLVCGMAGSRQGWLEAPYLPCPAGADALAAALVAVPFAAARVRLVPGLAASDAQGVPEVMRGEETQLVGAELADGLVCLPGSHSKWARIEGGRVTGFTTHMTGEAFAALRDHTILGRLMPEPRRVPDLEASGAGSAAGAAFDAGVARAAETGGLLHHLFGVRALGLSGRLADANAGAYLSGLLIGHELEDALPPGATLHLLGAAPLCALYARAARARGTTPRLLAEDAAAAGLARIAALADWT